jgi:hypothetical protein
MGFQKERQIGVIKIGIFVCALCVAISLGMLIATLDFSTLIESYLDRGFQKNYYAAPIANENYSFMEQGNAGSLQIRHLKNLASL